MNEDAKKIAFISCVNDEEMYAECVRYLRHLDMPQGFSAEVVPVRGAPSMAAGYEAARRASSALYKVYMHQDILLTEKSILRRMVEVFRANPAVGLIGLAGCRHIPADGVWWESKECYASLWQVRHPEAMELMQKRPVPQAGVEVDERGFIHVDKQMRTNVPHIFAIGDIVGQPMLAHKGVHEGHVAAEVIAGQKHYFDPKVIPSIAYTEPEVAWVGKTEKECKQEGLNYEVAKFPWAASGRAIASECSEGMTKLIFDKDTHRILGGAIVGVNGGELLGEIGLAIEMGCDAEDIALTIHAHPTLHESVGLAAEVFEGSITDLPNAKAKKK